MSNYVNLQGDPTGSRAIPSPGRCGQAYVSSDWTLPARPHNPPYLLARRNAQGKGPVEGDPRPFSDQSGCAYVARYAHLGRNQETYYGPVMSYRSGSSAAPDTSPETPDT